VEKRDRRDEARYRTLVEQLRLVTYIDALDERSSNIYTSPQLEAILGYPVEEWQSDPDLFGRILHPDDRERVLREVREANETGERFVSEYRLIARDGRVVWLKDECVTVHDAHGEPVYSQGYLLDIGERKAAEEASRESEERFRSLADDAPVLIWTTDAEGRITFLSRSWLEFTGRPEAAQLGFGWVEDIHPDDTGSALDEYMDAVRRGQPYTAEYRLRRHDGEFRWILDTGRPRYLPDGTPVGYIGVGIDVTEQREAQAALERRERILEAVATIATELATAAAWEEIDVAGRLGEAVGASRAYLFENERSQTGALLGVQRCEWVAAGVRPMIDDPSLAGFDYEALGFGRWVEVLASGGAVAGPVRDFPASERAELGRQEIRSILVVPVAVEGAWWGVVGFDDCVRERSWTDAEVDALRAAAGMLGAVIERQRTARSLQETRDRFEALVETSQAGILGFDREGRITVWNRAAERIFGWSAHEVIGRFPPHLSGDARPEFLRLIERGFAGESWSNLEVRRHRKDGSPVDLSASTGPLRDADGRIIGLTSVVIDITGQKQVIEALRESEMRFAAFMDTTPAVAFAKDAHGRYLYANARWHDRFGQRLEDILGRTDAELFPPERAAEFRAADEEARVAGGPITKVEHVETLEGLRTFMTSKFPFSDASGSECVGGVSFDITELERIERELSETSQALEAIVDSSPLPIVTFDRDGRVTRWNDAAERTFGWSADEVIGRFNPLMPEGKEKSFRRAIGFALKGKSWRSVEVSRQRKDGSTVVVSASSAPLREASGAAVGMVAVLDDVTERRRAEATLRESEERFRTLVANVPGAIYRCSADADWTMRYLSDAAEEITGYPASDFIDNAARSFASVIHEDDRAEVARTVDDAIARREPFELEYRIVRADGSVRWVTEKGQPATSLGQDVLWLDGAIFDVTEQKRAQEERASTQALLDSIVENLPVMLFLKDADELRFARVNRALEEIAGLSRDELLGKTDFDVFPVEQAEFFLAKDREVLERGQLLDISQEQLGDRVLHTRKVPIVDESGRARYLLGISMDVTDAKRAAEERERLVSQLAEQNRQLRELDRLKDEFVALVSHELRTPLTSILGYLELLLDGDAGGISAEQERFLKVIDRNAKRLVRLVGDLLLVAQIEAGTLALEHEPIDLAHVVSECIEAARPTALEKGLQLSLEGHESAQLLGDRTRLAQLLDNLVSNAIKFTPAGGRVVVRLWRDDAEVRVEVADSGIGIAAEEQDQLFQRFFRTAEATRLAIQGTGLGLTITKAIAEAHGGGIELASERGAGTTFIVRLPVERRLSSRRHSAPEAFAGR
jgi:PAS domain S-box-containing protein